MLGCSSSNGTATVSLTRVGLSSSTSVFTSASLLLGFPGWFPPPPAAGIATGNAGTQVITGGCRHLALAGKPTGSADGNGFPFGNGSRAAEQPPVRVRRGVPPGPEVVPQGGGVAEADVFGDGVHGVVGVLQQLLGQQHPLRGQPAQRGGPGLS